MRKVWLFDEGNYELLNNMLLSIEWNTFFSITDNIDVLSDNLTDILHHFTELCIPSKIVTVRPGDKPGMTSEDINYFVRLNVFINAPNVLVCLSSMHILAISGVKLKLHFVKLVIHFIPTYQIY